jgi:hypothetical protein
MDRQDDRGRWVTDGRISCREFIGCLLAMAEYIETVRGGVEIPDIPVELVDVPIDLFLNPWRTTASSGS